MEWLLALAVATVAGTVGLVATSSSSLGASLRAGARRRVAQICSLTDVATGPAGAVSGRAGALAVRLEAVRDRPKTLRIEIDGLAEGVEITPAGRAPVPGDVTIGDPLLDGPLVLRGVPATVRGLFAADVRARMLKVLALDVEVHVRAGSLVAELRGGMTHAEWSARRLATLLDLAHALEPGASEVVRLAVIARTDPLESVRAKALESLVTEAPDDPSRRAALRDATRDASYAIRLRAAIALGEEGHEVLYDLASDPATEGAVAVGALDALGPRLTLERTRPLLEAAVEDLRAPLACALLRRMGRGGAPEAAVVASVLAGRIARESSVLSAKGAAIAVAAAEALGETAAPEAEAPLIAALGSLVPGLPPAAARSLGRVGTAQAVPALRDAEERGGEVRRAAREAIALIQSRLVGATPGQVSLTDGGAGQLSVVGATDGRVSLGGRE